MPMLEAIRSIDNSVLQIALVVDENDRLLGSITDGDIRRAILKGVAMDRPVTEVMNASPLSVPPHYQLAELKATMARRGIHQVPVVDAGSRVIDLVIIDDLIKPGAVRDNWVILMAGGQGMRLRPLTEAVPKPLVEVGGKPLLESIIEKFVAQGFVRFQVSVNYLGNQIKARFKDGREWNAEIRYIDESEPLGTAGALSLLDIAPKEPIVVMNADLMTEIDFSKMLDFHREREALATMAVREYDLQVPFGVVNVNDSAIVSIDEKPAQRFLVNAGIYVLEPETLKRIPRNTHLDMPTLFGQWIEEGRTCAAFPIHEYWLDVGRLEDLSRANKRAQETHS
ncbi:MAG: alcohol dehydrogenase [Rhodospirillales bacterium CG15_BIG_FIL_POST_REV_8_21_14_020_66_15]|nr:MAG: alcohol dehydrogenase [Rhodospirillales bacterium CG15_BIG_FIL_POST_REV_8_21_14_020_66_15]